MTPSDKSLEEAKELYGRYADYSPTVVNKIALALDRARLEWKNEGMERAAKLCESNRYIGASVMIRETLTEEV